MVEKILLDVDTGSDDAVAIMAAVLSPDIEVEAVCSVAGNKDIDKTTENTLRVIELLGADVPVYRGCEQPLVKFLRDDRLPPVKTNIKGEVDGEVVQMHADYLNLPEATIEEMDVPAPIFYVDYLRNLKEPITIVAVGPLTNVAMALMLDPGIVKNIKQIVIMGGGYQVANATPTAEFNLWFDPEAAQKVLNSGAKIVFVPLDATHAACVSGDDCQRLREINTDASNFAAELIEQRITAHNAFQPLAVPNAAAVHDALAVCYLIDPTVLQDLRFVRCDIGFGDFSEGQTVIDTRYLTNEKNCYFAFDGDRVKFVDLLCDILARTS